MISASAVIFAESMTQGWVSVAHVTRLGTVFLPNLLPANNSAL